MKLLSRRCALRLGQALLLMATSAVTSEARAQIYVTRGEIDVDHHHWRFSRAPLEQYGLRLLGDSATWSVPVCAAPATKPLEPCRLRVEVMVDLDGAAVTRDFTWHAVQEQNSIRSLERGARAYEEHRRLVARPVMHYGIGPEPIFQFQLKREMLVLLSTITSQPLIARAAAGLSPTSSIRAIAEMQADDRTRARATFVEIEEIRGPNPLVTPGAVQAAYAATGGALFFTGLGLEKLIHGRFGEAFTVHPQIWPPGITMTSVFDVP